MQVLFSESTLSGIGAGLVDNISSVLKTTFKGNNSQEPSAGDGEDEEPREGEDSNIAESAKKGNIIITSASIFFSSLKFTSNFYQI